MKASSSLLEAFFFSFSLQNREYGIITLVCFYIHCLACLIFKNMIFLLTCNITDWRFLYEC